MRFTETFNDVVNRIIGEDTSHVPIINAFTTSGTTTNRLSPQLQQFRLYPTFFHRFEYHPDQPGRIAVRPGASIDSDHTKRRPTNGHHD